ncbi:MAG: Crp/Fnr family transcriptional regulator [bacterium]|nr:Crp/Fnr family transcriptional regulator [bacterium]
MGDKQHTLEKFFSASQSIPYKKGEIIIRPGDVPQGIYFLKKGYIRSYSVSRKGEELTFFILQPRDFFPLSWGLTDRQIYYYYETMTSVEVKRVQRDSFVQSLKSNPEVLFEITTKVLMRLRIVFERMEYLAYGNANHKVASILLFLVEEYATEQDHKVTISVPLTHKDIASLVGMTRETVSVEMSKLAGKGIISHEGKFVVVSNPQKLRQESLLKA